MCIIFIKLVSQMEHYLTIWFNTGNLYLLEWLGLTSAASDTLDRWAAFVLVVLAAVVFDLLLQLGIVRGCLLYTSVRGVIIRR